MSSGAEAKDQCMAVLLVCFAERKAAARARRPLDTRLRSNGDVGLDTTVVDVDTEHKASAYHPHRHLFGTLTPALTWGVFGLLTFYLGHHGTRAQLARIGTPLPAQASALAILALTRNPGRLLEAAVACGAATASVAAVGDDLTAQVLTATPAYVEILPGSADGTPQLDPMSALSMIMLRYPDRHAARHVAARIAAGSTNGVDPPAVEFVIETDRDGHRHVSDPRFGVAAIARSDVISWGGFGLICGATSGGTGGGVLGLLEGGIVTGVAWGIFGLGAGALFGRWAGTAFPGRRLKAVGALLAPDTSMLVAWGDGPVDKDSFATLATAEAQQLVLRFTPVAGGAALAAPDRDARPYSRHPTARCACDRAFATRPTSCAVTGRSMPGYTILPTLITACSRCCSAERCFAMKGNPATRQHARAAPVLVMASRVAGATGCTQRPCGRVRRVHGGKKGNVMKQWLAIPLAAAMLVPIACSSKNNNVNAAACPNLAQLQQDLQAMQNLSGSSTVADVRAAQQKVDLDVAAVKKSATKARTQQIAALEKAQNDLDQAVKALPDNTAVSDAVKQVQPQLQAVVTARASVLSDLANCKPS
jgi:hypothetical protein